MPDERPIKLQSLPGIKRDGTKLEGDHYIDGQWCRFQRGLPRKMGGYQSVTDSVPEIARGMNSFSQDGLNFVHIGHPNSVGQYQVNNFGNLNAFNDRTPAALVASSNNLWQFDVFNDSLGTGNHLLIAHPGQNISDIDNSVATQIFAGSVTATTILNTTGLAGLPTVSGGIVAIAPFLFAYGDDGLIFFSAPNNLSIAGTSQNPTQQKIVFGIPLRGAGSGPAALFWSLDALIRATFTGGTPDFAFDTMATDISILSSQSVVEYDGVYYWPGVDRFLLFNGVVREVPNNLNQNWFFDNLNFTQRQKVFGFKVPRFGEIWWCYPRGSATECTHAIVFNVRENIWYDTALPDSDLVDQGRTAGLFAKVYNKPFMVDNFETTNGRTLWQHETTKDKVENTVINAIPSHFETAEIAMFTNPEQPLNKEVHVGRVEPDFVQTGDMTLTVRGRQNAKAPVVADTPETFVAAPTDGTDETIKLKIIRRLMSFRFDSNEQGGDYEYGETYAHISPMTGRVES